MPKPHRRQPDPRLSKRNPSPAQLKLYDEIRELKNRNFKLELEYQNAASAVADLRLELTRAKLVANPPRRVFERFLNLPFVEVWRLGLETTMRELAGWVAYLPKEAVQGSASVATGKVSE